MGCRLSPSMAGLAAECGISKALLYHYCASKEALLFGILSNHLQALVDSVENARDAVLSLFDLYTTRASHKMNDLMKRLTFATIIFGAMSVIVGAFGMNFEVGFFKAGSGFWFTVIGMGAMSLILLVIAKLKHWI